MDPDAKTELIATSMLVLVAGTLAWWVTHFVAVAPLLDFDPYTGRRILPPLVSFAVAGGVAGQVIGPPRAGPVPVNMFGGTLAGGLGALPGLLLAEMLGTRSMFLPTLTGWAAIVAIFVFYERNLQ